MLLLLLLCLQLIRSSNTNYNKGLSYFIIQISIKLTFFSKNSKKFFIQLNNEQT